MGVSVRRPTRAIATRSVPPLRGCIEAGQDFAVVAPECAFPEELAASCSATAEDEPTRSRQGLASFADASRAFTSRDRLACRLAGGVIHADLFTDNVLFMGDGVRPDRFLFRLQRRLRLRPRDLPQRLVLRARWRVQQHQGTGPARRLREVRRDLAVRRSRPLPTLARGAALRFMLTRLDDWITIRWARRAPEGSARIRPQARLSPPGRERRRLRTRA